MTYKLKSGKTKKGKNKVLIYFEKRTGFDDFMKGVKRGQGFFESDLEYYKRKGYVLVKKKESKKKELKKKIRKKKK